MKILIADDDFRMRNVLLSALRGFGDVDVACNGSEAWQAWQFASESRHPYDLVMLDMNMPGMEGDEVLSRIRGREIEKGVYGSDRAKVVMATSRTDKDHVIGSFHEGCDGYIRKPYTPTSVIDDLRREHLV